MLIRLILMLLSALMCIRQFHITPEAVTAFLWLSVLIEIAWKDHKTMTIPDQWNLLLCLVGILSVWTMPGISLTGRFIGMAVISVPMILTDLVVPGGFGGGDIKLMAAAGLMLGWRRNLTAAILAVMAGGIYALYLLITGKAGRKDSFAFGPFLCGGLAAALFIL